jgi:Asp-tRNA(Asn)/Glu-tRNA(Gln) amidotransferase A subunit family amidase
MSACEMAEKIKTQELSSLEITETIIERIEKINPIINAYCTTTFGLARETAKIADNKVKKGEKLSLLNGIPVSIKDLIMTKGIRTTFGSKLYENFVPDEDSIIIKRIKEAGCVILGKTNTPEFGFKGVTDNLIFNTTKNPWNLKKTTGGSTGGGGAAVASGLGPLTLGTDAGGSIRIPSCFCGVYGIKPSFGRVPIHPWPILHGDTYDHYGPIARYVEDAALMLDTIKGPDDNDKHSLPEQKISYFEGINLKPNKLKIAYSFDLGYAKIIDQEVEEIVLNSVKNFEQFGWNTEKVKMKMKKPELSYYTLYTVDFAYDLQDKLKEWRDKIDPDLVKMIEAGMGYSGIDVMRALDQKKAIYNALNDIFKNYDLLITPTTAVTAFEQGIMYPPKINDKNVSPTAWQAFTFPINMTGHPAASIPCGWSKEGLPIGMQIIGKRFDELTVLQASKAFQEIAPWQDKKPQFN